MPDMSDRSRPRSSALLEETRQLMRTLHLAIRTEESYPQWIEGFLRFHQQQLRQWRRSREMGSDEVNRYLTQPAVD